MKAINTHCRRSTRDRWRYNPMNDLAFCPNCDSDNVDYSLYSNETVFECHRCGHRESDTDGVITQGHHNV